MLYIERWKKYLILAVMLWGVLYAMPNVLGKQTTTWMQAHLPAFLPVQTINLGLDLRGGSHLLLEVQAEAVIEDKLQALMDQLRSDLRKEHIGYVDLKLAEGVISFKPTEQADLAKAKDIVHELESDLDLSSTDGVISAQFSDAAAALKKRAAMDQSVEIVRRRIDETGTREPSIQRQGDNRILVQLPGVDDPEQIKRLLGQTAKLTFRLVEESASGAPGGRIMPGTERLPSVEDTGRQWIVQKRVMVSGDSLVDAQASFQNGEPVVSFRFDSLGGKRFGEATAHNTGRLFAIVLDNKVISAPVIREAIPGGSGVISGHFTTQSANDLALLLRAGALPAPIKVIEERTVGPGLGEDSIKAGAVASIVGLVAVMVFVVMAYGLFGIFADIALLFNMALIFGLLSLLQATLTLPGIAGIVLTIGMSVDANVLIFERIREELRLGRTPLTALDAGFKHALPAIMDANLTTLIAAFLLFIFGSGPIKGFAVTLSIGIITSIFSAVMITHLIVVLWTQWTKPKEIPI